jgi:hypothetical protein
MEKKPDCYKCRFRKSLHTEEASCCCMNKAATVLNHAKSLVEDAFNFWPFYFNPAELTFCDGFVQK